MSSPSRQRSVSFGQVEEQVFEDVADDYWEEDGTSNDNLTQDGTAKKKDDKQQQQQQQSAAAASSLMCPNCGSRQIESEPASGASICIECGVLVEESAIVSAVEFVEGNGGSSSMVGQFVSATSSKAYTGGPGRRGGGYSKDSRETTLANGRRRIQDVAGRLRLGPIFVDAAHRLFTVAVEKNFVQGRRTTHVVAACLYIACRQEKSQHMLIDFSDALQVNVYTLGTTFLKFRRLLGLKLEIIDPALYVYRFAAHLDLDEKANAVAMTALRLVGRMKRDWIVAGRRPAGICAAALLIAARAHGFSRHHQDVTRILRVCGLTVNTRVKEFEQTPSSALTLHQFNHVDVEQEMDPPRYTKNKILEARAKAIQENNVELLTSGALDDPLAGKGAKRWRDPKRLTSDKMVQAKALYQSIEKELSGATEPGQSTLLLENGKATEEDPEKGDNGDGKDQEEASEMEADDGKPRGQLKDDSKYDEDAKDVNSEEKGGEKEANKKDTEASDMQIVKADSGLAKGAGESKTLEAQQKQLVVPADWADAYPKSKFGKHIVLPDHATPEEMMEPTAPVEARLKMSEWKEDLPDFITDEVESMFRSDEEVAKKEVIFNKINKDYIVQQERKEKDRLSSEAADKGREEDMAAQAEGHIRYMKKGRKKKKDGAELTPQQALLEEVKNRKISRKINYDAMSSIFDDEGTFATDTTTQMSSEGGMEFGEL